MTDQRRIHFLNAYIVYVFHCRFNAFFPLSSIILCRKDCMYIVYILNLQYLCFILYKAKHSVVKKFFVSCFLIAFHPPPPHFPLTQQLSLVPLRNLFFISIFISNSMSMDIVLYVISFWPGIGLPSQMPMLSYQKINLCQNIYGKKK